MMFEDFLDEAMDEMIADGHDASLVSAVRGFLLDGIEVGRGNGLDESGVVAFLSSREWLHNIDGCVFISEECP